MSCYFVATINIHDRDTYAKYESGLMEVFSKFNGKMLAVDEEVEIFEGAWPYTRTVIIEFPSEADAKAWYESEDYQALAKHRFAASEANLALIKGL